MELAQRVLLNIQVQVCIQVNLLLRKKLELTNEVEEKIAMPTVYMK